MRRGRLTWICIPLAAAALTGCGGSDGSSTGTPAVTVGGRPQNAEPAVPATTAQGGRRQTDAHPGRHRRARPAPTLEREPMAGPSYAILRLLPKARVALRAAPGGRVVGVLRERTEFNSPQTLAVVRQRGAWMGVDTPLLRNGRLGWVRFDRRAMQRYWTRYSIAVDLGRRLLTVRYGSHVQGRYPVTVGAASSATPPGRFGITDALTYDASPFYGCCALALSGHQERLPAGWLGGNRIAIHGTPGPVGQAASHGCIRATDATMRLLFRSVPLGTPVFVRR